MGTLLAKAMAATKRDDGFVEQHCRELPVPVAIINVSINDMDAGEKTWVGLKLCSPWASRSRY